MTRLRIVAPEPMGLPRAIAGAVLEAALDPRRRQYVLAAVPGVRGNYHVTELWVSQGHAEIVDLDL